MKKIIIYAAAAALAISAASCQKEGVNGNVSNDSPVFTATIDDGMDTKTTLTSDRKVYWVDGDQITINGVPYEASLNPYELDYDPRKAEFTKVFGTTPTGTYYAFYPTDIQSGATAGGTLPAKQTIYSNSNLFANIPMFATGTTTDLSFKNICAVLAIKVKSADFPSVRRIRVSSSNCAMRGAFTVTDGQTAVLTNPTAVSNSVILDLQTSVTTAEEGTVFYIAIPAQTYRNLKIALSADGGTYTKSMTTKKDADIAVAVNTIYPITFKATTVLTTTGTAKATINGSEVDVNWVQLWTDGPKFATTNYGTSTIYGQTISWKEATSSTLWGSNWKLPSKDEMEGLMNTSKVSVSVDHEGFYFTGIQDGYNNTLFIPITSYLADNETDLWTSSTDEDYPLVLHLKYSPFSYSWNRKPEGDKYYVRLVLNE